MADKKDKTTPDVYAWSGLDAKGRTVEGETQANGESHLTLLLKKQNIRVLKIKKMRKKNGGKVEIKDIAIFSRQLSTMMRAGVPLVQGLDIIGKGGTNPAMQKLVFSIKSHIEEGNTLYDSLKQHPKYFDSLYLSLVAAGEQAGILEDILDRVATYKEKMLALRSKIKAALFYPTAVIILAFLITAAIMIFVVPSFKELFDSFGAGLPMPTQIMINISNFFVDYWWLIFGGIGAVIYSFKRAYSNSLSLRRKIDRILLKLPIFGELMRKAAVARWARTLATMFAAGVNLVDALDAVAGASGNWVYESATLDIKENVSTGIDLTTALQQTHVFPNMMLQMTAIGEESGSLDSMLNKVGSFYEEEVDDAVAGLSSLMEPIIMVVIGGLVGSMVISMYLPIFKMGSIVGGG
jgi:type IV pilus assembly protein PilC